MMTITEGSNVITMKFYYDEIGTPIMLDYNGTLYYYITNLQGDVVGIADNYGVGATYRYDAWGNIIASDSASNVLNNAMTNNPLRYRGYIYDTETGFYYLQSRYYDPAIGRFINPDGTEYLGANGDLVSFNLYAYCSNNPVMGYDPIGNWDWSTLKEGFKLGVKYIATVTNGIIQVEKNILSHVNLTHTSGFFGTIGLGIFQLSGGPCISSDTKGNTTLQYSYSWSISTEFGLLFNSGSCGIMTMLTNCPDTSFLEGPSHMLGGTFNTLIENIPVFSGVDGYLIPHPKNQKKYFLGLSNSIGAAVSPSNTFEFHGGTGNTINLYNVNVFETWDKIHDRIMRW